MADTSVNILAGTGTATEIDHVIVEESEIVLKVTLRGNRNRAAGMAIAIKPTL